MSALEFLEFILFIRTLQKYILVHLVRKKRKKVRVRTGVGRSKQYIHPTPLQVSVSTLVRHLFICVSCAH